jgi:hypothetical protein
MSQKRQHLITDGRLVLLAVAGGIAVFLIVFIFISGGAVRHVEIFLPEKTYATVAFQSIDGEVKVVGLAGVAKVNPTILMRTGDFAMELTVVNQDTMPHSLYIDGLDISTKVLQPGESEILTFYSEAEGTYSYFVVGNDEPIGQIKAVKVTMYE